jgi:hypothetical protein
MTWRLEPASRGFERAAENWDAINRRVGGHVLLDSRFVTALLRAFGRDDLLLARTDDPGAAMAIVSRRGPAMWETFHPAQAPLGLMVMAGHDPRGDAAVELLRALPGHALQLSVLNQDPEHSPFGPAPSGDRLDVVRSITIPRLTIGDGPEAYWQARSRKLKQNLQRYRRRAEEQGHKLQFLAHEAAVEMTACVQDYARLEASGWKGRAGSAVDDRGPQAGFYQAVLETFARTGEAVVFELRLDSRVIASRLCLRRGGMLIMLKTAYDEAFRHLSPGMLLVQDIVNTSHRAGAIKTIEFYGRTTWHAEWTTELRTMYQLNCVRHPWLLSLKQQYRRLAQRRA